MAPTGTKPRKAAAKKAAKRPATKATKRATKKPGARKPSTRTTKKADTVAARNPALKAQPFRATGRPRGRPPRIDQPSLCDPSRTVGCAIVDMVADGRDPREAATLAGVFPETLKGWLARGAEAWAALQIDENPDATIPESEWPFVALFEELAVAESSNIATMFDVARHYALRDARWFNTYMGMRHPQRFGAQRVEHSGPGGGPIRGQVEVWSLDKLEAAVSVAESHARERAIIDAASRPTEIAS